MSSGLVGENEGPAARATDAFKRFAIRQRGVRPVSRTAALNRPNARGRGIERDRIELVLGPLPDIGPAGSFGPCGSVVTLNRVDTGGQP